MSGSVKRIGRRKITPEMAPIGIDNEMALGRISEGLCTSSAMLVIIPIAEYV